MIVQNSYPLVDENIINMLEKFWGFNLPKDYRNFLLQYNGGKALKRCFKFKNGEEGSAVKNFLGITPTNYFNLLVEYKDYEDRIPNNTLPIGYDSFGNLILISVKGLDRGKIYFWDHEMEADEGEEPSYDNLTLIADSFDEFINNLKEE